MPTRILSLCIGILGVLFLSICYVHSRRPPRVQLPAGVSLSKLPRKGEGHAPRGWYTNYVTRKESFWPLTLPKLLLRVKNVLGRSRYRMPTTVSELDLRSQLGDCAWISGETYLLARELFPEGYDSTWPELQFNVGYLGGWLGGGPTNQRGPGNGKPSTKQPL